MSRYAMDNRDALDFLSDVPSNSIDLVITDPPYESLEKHRKRGTTTRLSHSKSSSNDWFPIFPNSRFPDLFAHHPRERASLVREAMEEIGG